MRTSRRPLIERLRSDRSDVEDPQTLIASGRVLVDGSVVTNPRSMIADSSSVKVRASQQLRGELKLGPILRQLGVDVRGRVALDAGAAAGGFTKALLDAGASRVYAVDVGHGQLAGFLRQDPRVVNLEATNMGDLNPALVPDDVSVITLDLSYLSLSEAIPQLGRIGLAAGAELIGLIKPMFELGLDHAPHDPSSVERAVRRASEGAESSGWKVLATASSPITGAKGAPEAFIHATLRARNREIAG